MIIIAESGGGKSAFFAGVKQAFGDDAAIYPVDAITPGQAKGMKKGSGAKAKIIKADLAPLSLFDEINKWSMHYLEGVIIPIFGAEQGVRWREGDKWTHGKNYWKCMPVGTLLPYWTDFENTGATSSRKIHNIEQIMRRSLLFKLEDFKTDSSFLKDLFNQIAADTFENVTYEKSVDSKKNYKKMEWVVGSARQMPGPMWNTQAELEEAEKIFTKLAKNFQFSKRVTYAGSLVTNGIRLSVGMAMRYGRNTVTLDDVRRVCSILEMNAKALGFYRERCDHCGEFVDPGEVRCRKCRTPVKSDS